MSNSSHNISVNNVPNEQVRIEAEKIEMQDVRIGEANLNVINDEHDEFGENPMISEADLKQTELTAAQIQELTHLTDDQVDKALELVKLKHPLSEIRLWQALPYLKPFRRCIPKWCFRMEHDESKENVMTTDSRLSSMPEGASAMKDGQGGVRDSMESLPENGAIGPFDEIQGNQENTLANLLPAENEEGQA